MHALSEYLDIHAFFMVDYPSSNLMCYSGGTATSPLCCNGQPLPKALLGFALQLSSAAM